jgi:hypothetical protein
VDNFWRELLFWLLVVTTLVLFVGFLDLEWVYLWQ